MREKKGLGFSEREKGLGFSEGGRPMTLGFRVKGLGKKKRVASVKSGGGPWGRSGGGPWGRSDVERDREREEEAALGKYRKGKADERGPRI